MYIFNLHKYRRSLHFVIFGTKRVSRNSGITNFETLFSTKIPNWVQNFPIFSYFSKNEKLAKKVEGIWNLALKRVSKFVFPKFRDTLLVPKITKCRDLLYDLWSQQIYVKILLIQDTSTM